MCVEDAVVHPLDRHVHGDESALDGTQCSERQVHIEVAAVLGRLRAGQFHLRRGDILACQDHVAILHLQEGGHPVDEERDPGEPVVREDDAKFWT